MRSSFRHAAAVLAVATALAALLSGCGGGGPNFTGVRFLRTFPVDGANPRPLDVFIDVDGSLYVAAAGSWLVKKYSITGTLLEDLIPFLTATAGVFGPGQDIFVVSPSVGKVGAFSLAGVEKSELEATLPAGTLAYGVVVDAFGTIYVWAVDELATPDQWNILRCSGGVCTTLAAGGTDIPSGLGQEQRGMAVDRQGRIFYVDHDAGRIRVLDPVTLTGFSIGSPGAGLGQLDDPADVTVDRSGNVFVADTGNNRIQKFDRNGAFVYAFGTAGTGPGQFQSPQGIAVDGRTVVVADTGNTRIQVLEQF